MSTSRMARFSFMTKPEKHRAASMSRNAQSGLRSARRAGGSARQRGTAPAAYSSRCRLAAKRLKKPDRRPTRNENLRAAIRAQDQVLGLDIAMTDSALVQGAERPGDLSPAIGDLRDRLRR